MSQKRRHKKPPIGDFTATIERLSHEGRGVATREGKTIFIRYALPGETVRFQYTRTHRQYDEGEAQAVLDNPHPDRAIPSCPHFTRCGGCSLQHLQHPAQLQHKQAALLDLLANIAHTKPDTLLAPHSAEPYAYRRKARLGVRYVPKKGLPLVGFRETNGRFLSECHICPVLHPSLGEKIQALREMIDQLSIKAEIAQIEASLSDDQKILIFRHLQPFTANDLAQLQRFGEAHGFHMCLQSGGIDTICDLQGAPLPLQSYTLLDNTLTLDFLATDFTQVNFSMNQQMVQLACERLSVKTGETVLDLFCGLGNFSLALASQGARVTGIEGTNEMTERAKHNAEKNGLSHLAFYAFDLTQDFSHEPWAKPYDKLLIDPPRSGAEAVVRRIEIFSPMRIVYVSCNPATLARDAAILTQQKGYTLSHAGIIDMFAQTNHVESIAVFEKKSNG